MNKVAFFIIICSIIFACSSSRHSNLNKKVVYYTKCIIDRFGYPVWISPVNDKKGYRIYYKFSKKGNGQISVEKYVLGIKTEVWVFNNKQKPSFTIHYDIRGKELSKVYYKYRTKNQLLSTFKRKKGEFSEFKRYYYGGKKKYLKKIVSLHKKKKLFQKIKFVTSKTNLNVYIYNYDLNKNLLLCHVAVYNNRHELVAYYRYNNKNKLLVKSQFEYNKRGNCVGYKEFNRSGRLLFYKKFKVDYYGRTYYQAIYDGKSKLIRWFDYLYDDTGRLTSKKVGTPTQSIKVEHKYKYDDKNNRVVEKIYNNEILVSLHQTMLSDTLMMINRPAYPQIFDVSF